MTKCAPGARPERVELNELQFRRSQEQLALDLIARQVRLLPLFDWGMQQQRKLMQQSKTTTCACVCAYVQQAITFNFTE